MIVERFNVFETNSSSCHSLVRMSRRDWNDFKDGRILIRRDNFDIEEHARRYNKVHEDEIVAWEDFYNLVKKDLPNLHKTHDGYPFDNFDMAVINFVKENWSPELCKKMLISDWSEVVYEFPEEIIDEYSGYGGSPYVAHYKTITWGNIMDLLHRQYEVGDNYYFFQDDNGWKNAEVYFLQKEEGTLAEEMFIDRREKC